MDIVGSNSIVVISIDKGEGGKMRVSTYYCLGPAYIM